MADQHPRRPAVILLVEDEPPVQDLMRDALTAVGHQVWIAGSAAEAEVVTDQLRPDLIVVDLSLPDGSGLVLCSDLGAKTGAPVVVCSGTKRKDDLALAFKLGAVDFVQKPLQIHELRARVDAALRRGPVRGIGPQADRKAPRALQVGTVAIDEDACRVVVDDVVVPVTPTEYRLLHALAVRPGRVVPYDELCREVLGSDARGTRETLGVHARRLRAKLAAHGDAEPYVQAVRGFGYRLADPADPGFAA